jgi:hypothetical protein
MAKEIFNNLFIAAVLITILLCVIALVWILQAPILSASTAGGSTMPCVDINKLSLGIIVGIITFAVPLSFGFHYLYTHKSEKKDEFD